MKTRRLIRIMTFALLLAMIGSTATAATLGELLGYAKGKGFTVKSKSCTTTKPAITYSENNGGKDKLSWTNKSHKQYSITAHKASDKAKLQKLHAYMLGHYKWQSCTYLVKGTAKYGYHVKKVKKPYSTLKKYSAGVSKHVKGLSTVKTAVKTSTSGSSFAAKASDSDSYILNTNTKKVHRSTCKDAARISAKNKATSNSTLAELISQGYSACKNCKP